MKGRCDSQLVRNGRAATAAGDMKGRPAKHEIALTSDETWRQLTAEGLAHYTWKQKRPCANADMLLDALAFAQASDLADLAQALDGFNISKAARQGSIRVSEQACELAHVVCSQLTPVLPDKAQPTTMRWIVLASLAHYSRHLIASGEAERPPVVPQI